MSKNETTTKAFVRHPIVAVLGHVDHGKTTLLDTIRKSNVVAKESGGITQHLSAYEIKWNDGYITFLDTPGHSSFTTMRERGARVADIAILVVAADDGVKPQTLEALDAIRKANVPFIVALNKIDKQTGDADRIKAQLAEANVLVEGWGGNVPIIPISAKVGTGINELLDTVLLLAELEELEMNAELPAEGVIIEAHLDPRRGPSAMLLVTNGTLKKGTFILAGDAYAPVRILEDTAGKAIEQAGPSTPVRVVGFTKVPSVGALVLTFATKRDAEERLALVPAQQRKEDAVADIGIMIKSDVAGTLEALESEIRKLIPTGVQVKFFEGGVGEVTEGDVKTISAAKHPFVIGFRIKAKQNVLDLAERFSVTVKTFDIIYEASDWIKEKLVAFIPKEILRTNTGQLIVLKVFRSTSSGKIVGGRVKEGEVPKDSLFDVSRQGTFIATGRVLNVERNKVAVEKLREGEEGGMLVQCPKQIEERDTLQFFYERET